MKKMNGNKPMNRYWSQINGLIVVVFTLLALNKTAFSDDSAMRLYKKGNYKDAIKKYDRILKDHPDLEEAHYGKGTALYKSNQIEDAAREFENAISIKDPLKKSAVLYNMGNALFKVNRIDESLQFYKKALELNPNDMDAKYNFELAKAMMRQQNSQNKQQNDQNQQKKDQDQQQQQSDQKNQEQKKQEQQAQNQQEQMKNRQEKEKGQKEAAQILDALKEKEKNLMKERMKVQYSGIKKEKDW